MTNLVQVPWQPECWLTPDTLALLVASGNRLGVQLEINGGDGAWRSYAEQAALYQLYLRGGNIASNPDTGQRNHMRGAAFDLIRTDDTAQEACRAVGLVRDPAESWHWNNPNWQNMPIIPVNDNTTVAGGNSTPIPTKEQADMAKRINLRITNGKTDSDALFWYSERRGIVHVQTPAHWSLLGRLEKVLNDGAKDHFYTSEVDTFNKYYV